MTIYDGGPAFPMQPLGSDGLPEHEAAYGMSLRDYFAGQALVGMIARIPWGQSGIPDDIDDTVAQAAYAQSDAMLREREKTDG